MMKTLGFVSTAHIHFKSFADEISSSGGATRIGAIWDDDEDRGRRNAMRCNAEFVPDLADLTVREGLDGFVICAPNNQRLTLFEQLAAAGKPMMCEKPLALTAAEAREIRSLVAERDLVVTTGFFRKSYGVYRLAADLLRQDAVGRITHAAFRNAHDGAYRRIFDDPDVAWMADPRTAGGGGVLDMGAHAMHLLAWLFGPAEDVQATIENLAGIYPEVDDFGIIHLHFASGLFATVEAGWINIDDPGALAVYGNAGSFHATDRYDSVDAHFLGADKRRRSLAVPPSGPKGVSRLLAAMDGRISREELALELAAAADAAAMMEAAYRSNAAAAWQKVERV